LLPPELQFENLLDLLADLQIGSATELSTPIELSTPAPLGNVVEPESLPTWQTHLAKILPKYRSDACRSPICTEIAPPGLAPTLAQEVSPGLNANSESPNLLLNLNSAMPMLNHSNDAEALQQLREILLGAELAELLALRGLTSDLETQLQELQQRVQDPAQIIDRLLPILIPLLNRQVKENPQAAAAALAPAIADSIAAQIQATPAAIAKAIAPEIAAAVKQQIHLEREAMVDALYPVMGSTIAKYLAEALRSINEKIETAFSPEGIQRKIRAKMRGVSEAELLLQEALPFTVEAIFLIQKGSGLVVAETQHADSQMESDMVAGMLTAIRSFANDCMARSSRFAELNQIDYGNFKILLEVAGYCYLAVVVQGEPSRNFVATLRQALSTIVEHDGSAIAAFNGNPATIPAATNQTLQTLSQQFGGRKPTRAKKISPRLIFGITVLGAIGFWGFWQFQQWLRQGVETNIADALSAAPELAVYRLNVQANHNSLQLTGKVPTDFLRQKAEQVAKATMPANWTVQNRILAVEVPADPVLAVAEVKRVTAIFNRLPGTTIAAELTDRNVTVTGKISQPNDATAITQAFSQIPGVKTVTNTVQIQSAEIATRIYFQPASTTLQAIDKTTKLSQIATFLKQHPNQHLRIIGFSNPATNPAETQRLALKRAETLGNELIQQGIAPERLHLQGIAKPMTTVANSLTWQSRSVMFESIMPYSVRP
jgi:outer membrane protein OmpA-like peptidoglycan-associated protein